MPWRKMYRSRVKIMHLTKNMRLVYRSGGENDPFGQKYTSGCKIIPFAKDNVRGKIMHWRKIYRSGGIIHVFLLASVNYSRA